MIKGHLNAFNYPFSLFLNFLEATLDHDENEFKKRVMAVRIGRFMESKKLEKFLDDKKDDRSDFEKMMDFQKGIA